MYGRSTANNPRNKHFYLKGSKGLFYYPKSGTRQLIITESIIDFLSLYQIDEIRNYYNFLPIYGTNRLNGEHKTTISKLEHLQEIIFFLDGDKAGETAVKKYADELRLQNETVQISKVATLESEDINSLLQGHETEIFTHLIETRSIIFSSNETSTEEKKQGNDTGAVPEPSPSASTPRNQKQILNTENPHNIRYTGQSADYYIKGGLRSNLDSLKVSMQIVLTVKHALTTGQKPTCTSTNKLKTLLNQHHDN